MKVVIAPDSFKESISAVEAAQAMARGVRQTLGDDTVIDVCPIADGGEGTVLTLLTATQGQEITTTVLGPLGEPVGAVWGLLGHQLGMESSDDTPTAVIELASAAGLALVAAEQRNPSVTSTFGVGQLISEALDRGVRRIVLGIGGSATNDGGCGAAQALGVTFEAGGTVIDAAMCGGLLAWITRIDTTHIDARLADCEVVLACDVSNPLYGPHGAAAVYAPQKGANDEMVAALDKGLTHYAGQLKAIGHDVAQWPGAGAAGGFGAGAVALLGGRLQRGADLVLDAVGFEQRIADADLCLTGEGKLDSQSLAGKAVMGVAQRAKQAQVPAVALVGCVGEGAEDALKEGLTDYQVIGEGLAAQESIARAAKLLEAAAARVVARYARH